MIRPDSPKHQKTGKFKYIQKGAINYKGCLITLFLVIITVLVVIGLSLIFDNN